MTAPPVFARGGAAALFAAAVMLVPSERARGFATMTHAELTRGALACRPGRPRSGRCLEPASLAALGVAAIRPDVTEKRDPVAHCLDGDYLPGTPVVRLSLGGAVRLRYPHSRAAATERLHDCALRIRGAFEAAVAAAGSVRAGEHKVCPIGSPRPFRNASCTTFESLGRALHAAQDFYAHGNWTDRRDSLRPAGLAHRGPSPLLEPLATAAPVPRLLTTAAVDDRVATETLCASVQVFPGIRRSVCAPVLVRRFVDHRSLNKDTPASPRSAGGNYERAVAGAVAETRRLWAEFRAVLLDRYGPERGAAIACALTRDDGSACALTTRAS